MAAFSKALQARRKFSAKKRPPSKDRLASNSTLRVAQEPIAAMSDKRAAFYRDVYGPMRDEAVGDGREPCQILSPVCTGFVEHLHEPLTRGRAGGLEAAVRDGITVACCDACNSWCSTDGQTWARESGFLVSRKPR